MKQIAKVLLVLMTLSSIVLVGCGGTKSTVTPTPAPTTVTLSAMAVAPGTSTVAAGLTKQLSATGSYSDNATKDLSSTATWASSDPTVATVSSTGLVTTKKKGTVTITATSSSVSGTATITVTDPQLTAIAVAPGTQSVAAGLTQQFTATGTYTDASTKDITATVSWTSSNPAVATVSASGMVTSKAQGSATVTATSGSISNSASFAVTAPLLVSISVTPALQSLSAGQSFQFVATGTYSDSSTKDLSSMVAWSSSNASVATISASGMVTSKSQGSVNISAALGSVSNAAALTVTAAGLVSVSIAPTTQSVPLGQAYQFTATGAYSDGSTKDVSGSVTWSSSDTGIAAVSSTGMVTNKEQGTVTITAASGTMTSMATFIVTAPALVSMAVAPTTQSLAAGQNYQFTATGTYTDGSTKDISAGVTWTLSDATVATVSGTGLLTSKAAGSGTITASSGSVTAQASFSVSAATVQSIAVKPNTPTIPLGGTLAFAATATMTDGTTNDVSSSVTWSSSDISVATIDTTGNLTALKQGAVSITATSNNLISSATVTIAGAALKSINIVPATISVAKGESQQFAAYGLYTDNSQQDLTALVTWSSSNGAIAGVNAGLAQGLTTGTASISATYNSVSGSADLQVTTAVLNSLTISPDSPSVAAGGFQQFTVTGVFSDGSSEDITSGIIWSSDNTAVASVDNNGVAAALTTGTASISGCMGSVCDATQLTITPATLTSIAVTPTVASIAKGTTQQFTAIATFSDGSTQDITVGATWTASDAGLASVNASGLASGASLGTGVVITATSGSISGSAVLDITDAVLQSITITPAMPSLGINATQQFTATGVYSDGNAQDVTNIAVWTSSDSNIALTTYTGEVTAISRGTTVISAGIGSVSGSTTLTVSNATLTAITVNTSSTSPAAPATVPLTMGQRTKLTFYAWGKYSDNSVRRLTSAVWTSSNGSIASVNGSGVVRSKGKTGTASITANVSGVSGSLPVKVTSASLVSLAITPDNASIAPGTRQQFVLTGTFSDGSNQDFTALAYWQSSSAAAATVSKGLATGVAAGPVTISASYRGLSASATLDVSAATLQSIELTPANPAIVLGAAQQFSAMGNFSDGTQQDITSIVHWTSSAPAVAVINSGLAVSASRGITNIGATFGSVTNTTVLTVN